MRPASALIQSFPYSVVWRKSAAVGGCIHVQKALGDQNYRLLINIHKRPCHPSYGFGLVQHVKFNRIPTATFKAESTAHEGGPIITTHAGGPNGAH